MALAAYAKERLTAAGLELGVSRTGNIQGVCRTVGRPAREVDRGRARARRPPRLRARPRLRGDGRRAARRRDREADARRHRPARRGAAPRSRGDEADLREVAGRAAAPRRCRTTTCPPPEVPEELRRARARRGCPEVAEPEIVRHFTELSTRNFGIDTGFYPLGSCTMKYNPRVNERVVALPGFRDLHPLQEEDGAQGALELMWRLQEILAEVCGPRRRLAAAGRRLAGRADRADADARLLRRPRRGRAAPQDRHPRHRARHEPGRA